MNGVVDEDEPGAADTKDAMVALERQARAPVGFVPASTGPQTGNQPVQQPPPPPPPPVANPDAIEVDIEDDDKEQ